MPQLVDSDIDGHFFCGFKSPLPTALFMIFKKKKTIFISVVSFHLLGSFFSLFQFTTQKTVDNVPIFSLYGDSRFLYSPTLNRLRISRTTQHIQKSSRQAIRIHFGHVDCVARSRRCQSTQSMIKFA